MLIEESHGRILTLKGMQYCTCRVHSVIERREEKKWLIACHKRKSSHMYDWIFMSVSHIPPLKRGQNKTYYFIYYRGERENFSEWLNWTSFQTLSLRLPEVGRSLGAAPVDTQDGDSGLPHLFVCFSSHVTWVNAFYHDVIKDILKVI